MTEVAPVKVAVLGGGVGAITAAFELSKPEHEGRYDVTVYQLGWRLGGKGASGRGPNQRIEEHGLHIWFGFYENSFRAMRECYEELNRSEHVPIRTVDDAFHPASRFGVTEQHLDRWSTWLNWFPDAAGEPGVAFDEGRDDRTVGGYIVHLIALAESAVRGLFTMDGDTLKVRTNEERPAPAGPIRVVVPTAPRTVSSLLTAGKQRIDELGKLVEDVELAGLVAALELASTFEVALDWLGARGSSVVSLLDTFVDRLEDRITGLLEVDETGRRVFELVDLVATVVRGLVRDEIVSHPDGLDALDNFDFRDWLYLHGARRSTVDGGLLRGIYDLVFAYRGGRPERPALAAGQGLRGTFRMFFDYRGSFAYRMQAGMGDVVFAPYYELLRRRGVKFEFFSRVVSLEPSDDGERIETIVVERQAQVKPDAQGGTLAGADYDPLVDVKGLPCWPAEPKWELLAEPPTLPDGARPDLESPWNQAAPVGEPRHLRAGEHFDEVIFGLSLGSVPTVCSKLVGQRPEWRAMVDHVGTVQTQALQIWLNEPTSELGGAPDSPIVAGYVEPFDTWADMSHLIEREDWPAPPHGPRSIHYFCSAMPGPDAAPVGGSEDFPVEQRTRVVGDAQRFLSRHVAHFLPGSARSYPQEFRWDLLVGGSADAVGRDRLAAQYMRANTAPSERYVQSLPGTSKYRLAPGDSGYSNLALAGDWTDTGFNAGCVEAATISGLLAACSITGAAPDGIVGYRDP